MPLGPERGFVPRTMLTEPHFYPSCREEAVAGNLDGHI